MLKNTVHPNDIILVQTCSYAPEQYDAFHKGKQVGYLRLRHGQFRVDYPDCGGETIYEAEPKGDACFHDDERERFLTDAKVAICFKLQDLQEEVLCPTL